MSLVSIKDILNNGYSGIFVFLLSLVCISFGISIIVTRNPVVSVLFLIGLFVTVAIILMTLGLNFVGLSYLLVYVGAVSILFLFILMLINIRTSELTTEGKNSLLLAIIAVISFNFIVNNILPYCVYIYDAFSSSLVYTYIQNFKNLFLSMFNAYAGTDGITKLFLEISRSSKEGFVFSKS